DALSQLDFLFRVEQRHLADLLQVVLDRVRGRARRRHLGGRKVIVVVPVDERLFFGGGWLGGRLGYHRGRGRGIGGSIRHPACQAGGGRVVVLVGRLLLGCVLVRLDHIDLRS